jgi:nitrate/TMAO reductase-like tetraheme cytochrome c subunit
MEPTAIPGSPRPGHKFYKYFALLAVFIVLSLGYEQEAQPQQSARRWHPTRVSSGASFVGDQVCAECHKERVISQRKSSMGMAMEPVAESLILSAHPVMTFEIGNYRYEIARRNNQSFYMVTDGKETITLPILYAFGQGKAGQTYILQYESAYFESLVSYYDEIKGLDFTIGAARTVPASLKEAIGRRMSKADTLKCFNCHATGAVSGGQLQLDKMALGVRCEACHGPGGAHAAAGKSGEPNAGLIFNPARLSGDELSQDFCASCHRGNEEFSLLKSLAINNVRFQPYRIFKSECYSDDRRISCTACHNPHEVLNEDPAYYDAKCLSCHQSGVKKVQAAANSADGPDAPACRVGAKNCSSCHMPKIEPPGAHFKFTDHYIRIVKSNEAYPN